MIVYVLMGYSAYEGGTLLGVYSNPAAAYEQADRLANGYDEMDVHSVVVDAPDEFVREATT